MFRRLGLIQGEVVYLLFQRVPLLQFWQRVGRFSRNRQTEFLVQSGHQLTGPVGAAAAFSVANDSLEASIISLTLSISIRCINALNLLIW